MTNEYAQTVVVKLPTEIVFQGKDSRFSLPVWRMLLPVWLEHFERRSFHNQDNCSRSRSQKSFLSDQDRPVNNGIILQGLINFNYLTTSGARERIKLSRRKDSIMLQLRQEAQELGNRRKTIKNKTSFILDDCTSKEVMPHSLLRKDYLPTF